MINQNSSQRSNFPTNYPKFNLNELSEVNRLLDHIEKTAIDSENAPIHASEISTVANLVLNRIIWKHENLQQIIQEALDDLRFGA